MWRARGDGDVGGFAVEAGGSDDVDVIAGESLGFVDRGRVPVIDAACLYVGAGEGDVAAVAESDVDAAGGLVDVGDRGDHAVVDAATAAGVEVVLAGHVLQQHDPVPDLEHTVADRECRPGEVSCCGGLLAGEGVEQSCFGAGAGDQLRVEPGGVVRPPGVDGGGVDGVGGVGEHDAAVFAVGVEERAGSP